MLKLNHVQTKSYLKIRASTYNAPAPKRERERIEKLTEVKAKYSRGEYSRKEFVRQMTFKAQTVYKLMNLILVERTIYVHQNVLNRNSLLVIHKTDNPSCCSMNCHTKCRTM